ncbi:MAG: hypothetical protein Q7S61_00465 [bacterium]|nr:hypothetical protein [bacterium]
MKKGNAPYIFLGLLCVIIVFVGGIRYGTKVEQANKTIHYLLSLTPTKSISRPPEAPITYTLFTHNGCRLGFTYPSTLMKTKESSSSAEFIEKGSEALLFSCEKDISLEKILDIEKSATASFIFKDKELKGYTIIPATSSSTLAFSLRNPITGRVVVFKVDHNLIPLLDSTLEFK